MGNFIPKNLQREIHLHEQAQVLQPSEEKYYRIWQSAHSPFSHKVMTYMNYKGIPYKRIEANYNDAIKTLPKLVGQVIIPVILTRAASGLGRVNARSHAREEADICRASCRDI